MLAAGQKRLRNAVWHLVFWFFALKFINIISLDCSCRSFMLISQCQMSQLSICCSLTLSTGNISKQRYPNRKSLIGVIIFSYWFQGFVFTKFSSLLTDASYQTLLVFIYWKQRENAVHFWLLVRSISSLSRFFFSELPRKNTYHCVQSCNDRFDLLFSINFNVFQRKPTFFVALAKSDISSNSKMTSTTHV